MKKYTNLYLMSLVGESYLNHIYWKSELNAKIYNEKK